jgi:hypothetical protein
MPLLEDVKNEEELHDKLMVLSRKELQQLSKEHGIKANQKTDALVKELCSVLAKQKLEEVPEHDIDEATDITRLCDSFGTNTTEEIPQEEEQKKDVDEVEDNEKLQEKVQEELKSSNVENVFSTALTPAHVHVPTTKTTTDTTALPITAVISGVKALLPSRIPKLPVLKQQQHQTTSNVTVKIAENSSKKSTKFVASNVKSCIPKNRLVNTTTTSTSTTKAPTQTRVLASKNTQNPKEEKKMSVSNRWKNVAPRVDCHRPIAVASTGKSKSRLSLQRSTTNNQQKKIPFTKVVLPTKRPKLNYKPYTGPVPSFSGESFFSPTKKRQKEDHIPFSTVQDKENQLPSRRNSSRPLSTTTTP